ncbi:MAG TPA: hypothetical protein VER58_06010 [Thermoanaerobaculia bacterium]|nr:hypothetical protein [Thermoanaerobaculia bacterium]
MLGSSDLFGWDFAVDFAGQNVATVRYTGLSLILHDADGEITVRNAGVDPRASFFRRYFSFLRNATKVDGWDTTLIDETTQQEVARVALPGKYLRFADGTEYIWTPNNPLKKLHEWSQRGNANALVTFQSDVIRILEQPHPGHTRFLVALGIRHLIL